MFINKTTRRVIIGKIKQIDKFFHEKLATIEYYNFKNKSRLACITTTSNKIILLVKGKVYSKSDSRNKKFWANFITKRNYVIRKRSIVKTMVNTVRSVIF